MRDLKPDLRGRRLARPSVTYAGEAIALAMPPGPPTTRHFGPYQPIPPGEGWLSQDLWALQDFYTEEGGGPSYSADVLIWRADSVEEVAVSDAPCLPMLQCLPNDELVIASSSGTRERVNGHIYSSSDGRLLRSFFLGDAIEHIYTTADGSIWVAYFDEGALTEIGRSGLVRFDARGNKLWGYNENRGPAPDIYDCYALNLAPRAVWLSAEPEFDVGRDQNLHVFAEDRWYLLEVQDVVRT